MSGGERASVKMAATSGSDTSLEIPVEKKPLLRKHSSLKMDWSKREVCFSVGDQKIRCRRQTLTSTSPILGSILIDALYNGKHSETVEIPDSVHPEHLKQFLMCLEQDENFKISDEYTVDQVAHVFRIAKNFGVAALDTKCREFLQRKREVSNAIQIYQSAHEMNELQLEYDTYAFIIDTFAQVIKTQDFNNLTAHNLGVLLKADEAVVKEIDLFHAVYRWTEAACVREGFEVTSMNRRLVLGTAVHLIRYPLMTLDDLTEHVFSTGLLTEEEIDAVTRFIAKDPKDPRRPRTPSTYEMKRLSCKPRGLAPLKTFNVCFYNNLIYNSEEWKGIWKYNLFSVNKPISVVSFGFDGPILETTIYDVKIKLIECVDENADDNASTHCIAYKEEAVVAKKQRVFHVRFDNAIRIKPNVYYRAAYSLRGPRTIWGSDPKKTIKFNCGEGDQVIFNYQYVDGQMPEMRFIVQ